MITTLKMFEINLTKPPYKLKTSLLLLFSLVMSLTVSALEIDVAGQVSKDIKRFKVFETQSKALQQKNVGGFVSIGADLACDFDSALNSIQDAIDSGATEIRVASNGTYQNNLNIENQSVVIRGGFADCLAADANQQDFSDLVLIDGSALAEPVVFISGSDAVQQIRLENLILTAGTSVFPKFGGGLSVQLAAVDLQLLRVGIIGNTGSAGAGMDIDSGNDPNGPNTTVTGRDVVFQFNQSSSIGGGLRCRRADVILTGMSLFDHNGANLGGGMYLYGGCNVNMYSEAFTDSLTPVAGLTGNSSLSNGGGAHVIGQSLLSLFGQRMCVDSACLGSNQVPITVQNNEAGTSMGLAGHGGGIYTNGLGAFYGNGLVMSGNITRENGGGVYVGDFSEVIVERVGRECWHQDRCNLIIANESGTNTGLGGAFYVDGGGLKLSQTYLEENRADFGTVISASGENTTVTLEGVVMDDNGDDGNDGFSDFSVVRADLGATLTVGHSTVVDNNVQGSIFDVGVALDSSMILFNSIVHDPSSGNLFGPVSGDLSINCLMAHEDNSFKGSQVVVDDPAFINRMAGDFHLSSLSTAIDMCQETTLTRPLDIDAEQRGWDDVLNNNGPGVFDAGADESYVNDVIFKHGFEA